MVTRDLAGSGSSPDHDAEVGYRQPPELLEPISPELALVDPELAALARALLPPVPSPPLRALTEGPLRRAPIAAPARAV
ncbi:MAG: hypothetical protein H0X39_17170, partial [Actinobacteria bacterium]|nr:hypothetical protein [Actinomycetota bacterium]